jgi:hypothetical protein
MLYIDTFRSKTSVCEGVLASQIQKKAVNDFKQANLERVHKLRNTFLL